VNKLKYSNYYDAHHDYWSSGKNILTLNKKPSGLPLKYFLVETFSINAAKKKNLLDCATIVK